jgi:flagellar biosynthetic protein FliR
VTALLIANLAFGVVSRAAPTLNIFSVGLPVSLVFGLLAMIAGLPALESSFIRLLAAALDFLRRLSGA